MNLKDIKTRSEIITLIRKFFSENNYLEVDTPLLAPRLIPESAFGTFQSKWKREEEICELSLIPSPEIWMKQLLALGSGDIFQISKSFRNGEPDSGIHNPEFTMLEWYKTGIGYNENIEICRQLIESLTDSQSPDYLTRPFEIITMEEAFEEWAGFSLKKYGNTEGLEEQLTRKELPFEEDDTIEVLFNRLFLTLVEPEFPQDRGIILKDYPAFIPTLAKTADDPFYSQRWELYVKGIEIANCYTEEDNPAQIEQYFRQETENGRSLPESLIKALSHHFPRCSGTALGVDRLLMLIMEKTSIEGVIIFPWNDIIPPCNN